MVDVCWPGPGHFTTQQLPNESARHPRQHLQPTLRKTNSNRNSCLTESVRHGFWLEFAGRDQTTLPRKLLQNSAHAQNCLKRPCGKSVPQLSGRAGPNMNSSTAQETFPYCGRMVPASVRSGTNKFSSTTHETPPYCGRVVPASVRSGTNKFSSTTHETPPYFGRVVPPPRLAFIILLKAAPVPLGPPTAQSPARQHCTGGPCA